MGLDWCGILSVTKAARRDKNRQGEHNSCGNQKKIIKHMPPKPLNAFYV